VPVELGATSRIERLEAVAAGIGVLTLVSALSDWPRVKVAAVVADLDGTIVRSDFSMSVATEQALDTIRAAGIPMVIATARTPPGVEFLLGPRGSIELAVCCSGAIGWARPSRTRVWLEMIAPDTVKTVVETALAHGAGVAGYDGEVWRMTAEYDRLSPDQPRGPIRVVVDPEDLGESPCCTMALRHAGGDIWNLVSAMEKTSPSAALSHVGRSTVLDVTGRGIDKGTGACRALATLGVAPETAISFGDMPNDLPLFRATGRAFAVGEADPTVMAAAHEVLADVEHDGFARKIAELAAMGWVVE